MLINPKKGTTDAFGDVFWMQQQQGKINAALDVL
jgi:hypothetical protein